MLTKICFEGANQMQRVGFVLKVKTSRLDEYKKRHEQVWPEMLDALRETGWHNYSLFLVANFGYILVSSSKVLPKIFAV